MTDILFAVSAIVTLLLIAILLGKVSRIRFDSSPVTTRVEALSRDQERVEKAVREEFSEARKESSERARGLRQEVQSSLKGSSETMLAGLQQISLLQKGQLESFSGQLGKLTSSMEKSVTSLRETVENKLEQIQKDSADQLEKMRQTVDERLQNTLEKRLGESFQLVSERLERVHQGLGEMQKLAAGVEDLKRVLTNVKARGAWGEVLAGNLLADILTPEQFEKNAEVRPNSGERVEFAIRMPGPGGAFDRPVLLSVDAKFPKEDYERVVVASQKGDGDELSCCLKKLERTARECARLIGEKYIHPPYTTDFAVMFLPTEGLYAEIIRIPGLAEELRRQHRVVIAGPTTFAALLNSLQMGFQTLAIQQRSSEVWQVLAAVKSEFGKFGDVLGAVKRKLEQASNTIDKAAVRTRAMSRKLRDVEELPEAEAREVLRASE